jgi:hypothetical protein
MEYCNDERNVSRVATYTSDGRGQGLDAKMVGIVGTLASGPFEAVHGSSFLVDGVEPLESALVRNHRFTGVNL